MMLVLASRVDRVAAEFIRYAGSGVKLLTPESLSHPGWRLTVPGGEPPVAVVEGERISGEQIAAVITRLPYIGEADLPQIAAGDRAYVASEMQAFLHAFLSALTCPVFNRPTPVCLAGPNWRRAQWIRAARAIGLPVFEGAGRDAEPPAWTVSVIGEACFGGAGPVMKKAASDLARAAGVHLLRVWFTGEEEMPVFLGADLWPDLSEPAIGLALRNLVFAEVSV